MHTRSRSAFPILAVLLGLLLACGGLGTKDVGPPNPELMALIATLEKNPHDRDVATRVGSSYVAKQLGPNGERVSLTRAKQPTYGFYPTTIDVSSSKLGASLEKPYEVGPSERVWPERGFADDHEIRRITDGPMKDWGMEIQTDLHGGITGVRLYDPKGFRHKSGLKD